VDTSRDSADRVREAQQRDLRHLQAIEAAADQTFVPLFGSLDWEEPSTGQWRARQPGFLLVAESHDTAGEVVGFAHVLWLEGTAHLEQLAVHPDHQRRGHGGALLEAVTDRARAAGYAELTLSTYADVAWNAPFYRRHGFEVIERPGPLLQRLREKEERMGLMRHGPRVVMRVALG
jgi:ribosomal protein S18 acetylase RimI-like enzyme